MQPTADGSFVLHHDFTLEGSTDAALAFPDRSPWRLVDFTLEEIRRLRVRPPQGRPAEAGEGLPALEEAGEGIPTLEEARALDRQLGWMANVELKLPPGLDGLELGRALGARLEAGEELVLSSFHFATLAGARQANPALDVGLLTDRPVEDPLALLEQWQAASWHPGTCTFRDEQLRAVLQAGRRVLVWTVNQEHEARRLAGLGVSGIIGDDPGMLARVLKGREA